MSLQDRPFSWKTQNFWKWIVFLAYLVPIKERLLTPPPPAPRNKFSPFFPPLPWNSGLQGLVSEAELGLPALPAPLPLSVSGGLSGRRAPKWCRPSIRYIWWPPWPLLLGWWWCRGGGACTVNGVFKGCFKALRGGGLMFEVVALLDAVLWKYAHSYMTWNIHEYWGGVGTNGIRLMM